MIKDNSLLYHPSDFDRTQDKLAYELFLVHVLSVDYERKTLTIQDYRDDLVYSEVAIFPAIYSSTESTEMVMPEQGAVGLACNWTYESGFRKMAIVAWMQSQAQVKVDAIAQRPIDNQQIQGWSDRVRASYRKAFPNQKTSSYKGGFTEKIDIGWDHQAADWSRDKVDADRRTWTQITSRKVVMTGGGVAYQGPINRPNAASLVPIVLPDGSQEFVSYLQPGAQPSDRYVSGKQDVIPFSESTQLVQEYSLDYIPPMEVIQTDLLDSLLGTTADPWGRTTVTAPSGQVAYDNETYMITQTWDHPNNTKDNSKTVGPTLNEGPTPARRAFILEKTTGTLVGYNRFDKLTYGKVLKPSLFIGPVSNPGGGRFGSDVESAYFPVTDSPDHAEARLAASCLAIRFPYEYNTTRLDVTKEGFTSFEIGSTLPKENIPLAGNYEHPHGAGRSLEAHLVGSAKLVVGKNRDEEEALDVTALGQAVVRLGADDTGLPNARRTVQTQIRSKGDAPAARTLQYWDSLHLKLKPGDSGVDTQGYNKTGAENVSLRAALDGSAVVRLGARNSAAKRRHLINGYQDGPGKTSYAVGDANRMDSHSPGRPNYGAGDSIYAFNDLTVAGQPSLNYPPFNLAAWSGTPVPSDPNVTGNTAMDQHGLSLDLHSTRDILVRVGANPVSGQSILLDTDGGLVAVIGTDKQGRSVTASLLGGCEITIKPNKQGKALRIELEGDIDITHKGNFQYQCTGDWITECTAWRHITKTDKIFTQQKSIEASLVRHTIEAPDIVHNQGSQVPVPGDENS